MNMGKRTDGPISRHLNRRLSLPISRAIVRKGLPISPNLMSLISFSMGIVAGLLFALRLPLWGGLSAQLSSVLDGCDGEIARLTGRESQRGAIFDAILDRLADGVLILGMAIFAYADGGARLWAIVFGFLALIGSYGISYSSAIARAHGQEDYPRAIAGRDARLFLIMWAGIAAALAPGAMLPFLGLLALSTLIELSWRLART
ncbi:MAG: CDP-alcohol phosphatidyltransferase family protein [Candidatus Bipolaricaulia bacterium]